MSQGEVIFAVTAILISGLSSGWCAYEWAKDKKRRR